MIAESKYFLNSQRLGFRRWAQSDLDLAYGLWGDPSVTRFIDARGKLTDKQVKAKLAQEIATADAHGIQYWPIFLLANDDHVGCCGLRPYDLSRGIHEIGFHICSRCWGQGFASEAARAVMRYAFDQLRSAGLFAGHHPDNKHSRRLLAKLGFLYTHDEFYAPTGLKHPSYILTAGEYARLVNHPARRSK